MSRTRRSLVALLAAVSLVVSGVVVSATGSGSVDAGHSFCCV
jgi:hypothetical protein